MKIFITGATGFIGSHILRAMVSAGHDAVALRRKKSSLARCADFSKRVVWLEQEDPIWANQVVREKPDAIVHCAWAGVTAADRANWTLQADNLSFFAELLQIAGDLGGCRFVALGSQAEYGPILGRVDETQICQPDTAYGATKLAALTLLQGCARQNNLNWVWLRLFSVYGPDEGGQWFIPNLIQQLKQNRPPQLSGCEQRYDYLHVHDLAEALLAVLHQPAPAGIFNLTSNSSLPLKEVVEHLRQFTGSSAVPAYGALPYRAGQSMHLEGDSARFYKTFAFQPKINIVDGLRQLSEAAVSQ